MNRLRKITDGVVAFYCLGCDDEHIIPLDTWQVKDSNMHRWSFNGNYEYPTLNPSINLHAGEDNKRCHSFIRDVNIEYLSDSHHKYRGHTVELPIVKNS